MHYASMRYAALLKYNPPGLYQNITHSGETKSQTILDSSCAGCCERWICRPSADMSYASMRYAALLKYNPPGLFQNISGETKSQTILDSSGAGCCERSICRPFADRLCVSMRHDALLKYNPHSRAAAKGRFADRLLTCLMLECVMLHC